VSSGQSYWVGSSQREVQLRCRLNEVSVPFGDLDRQSAPRKSDSRRHPARPASDDEDGLLVIESELLLQPRGQALGQKQRPGHLVPDGDRVQTGREVEERSDCPLVGEEEWIHGSLASEALGHSTQFAPCRGGWRECGLADSGTG
jgi:hypothetical protein